MITTTLTDEELTAISTMLGREPGATELAVYDVMWSEHCSYKSSRQHLAYFGRTTTEGMRTHLLAGIGANAGVVDIGGGWAATFKLESHNHPSFLDPYQGAATGVGGCVRDILAMGARPVAAIGELFLGPANALDTARVREGALAGIADYTSGLGLTVLPTTITHDPSYATNPLVNAGCIGVLRGDRVRSAAATGVGNRVVLYGRPTGLHGIGAAARASEIAHDDGSDTGVPAGDAVFEKRLVAATLQAYDRQLIAAISDLGAAGLSCATAELAAAGGTGMRIDLDDIPTEHPGMTAAEILCSETQERMCAVVAPQHVEEFLAVCADHDIPATVIGTVTDTGMLTITHHGETVVDVAPGTIADQTPPADRAHTDPPTGAITALTPTLREPPTPIAVTDDRSIVMATAAHPHATVENPYAATQISLAEAYRAVAATGARPLAITNCLNVGSPEDPSVMGSFIGAVHGLADGAATLGIPVTGGNVSFYNASAAGPILPTPLIGVLGVLDADHPHLPGTIDASPGPPQMLFLLGDTDAEPPTADLPAEQRLAATLRDAAAKRLITAAQPLAAGGLSAALTAFLTRSAVGAAITLPPGEPDRLLAAETGARALVVVPVPALQAFADLCQAHDQPSHALGTITPQRRILEISGVGQTPIES